MKYFGNPSIVEIRSTDPLSTIMFGIAVEIMNRPNKPVTTQYIILVFFI
jgi:hypothetical protein